MRAPALVPVVAALALAAFSGPATGDPLAPVDAVPQGSDVVVAIGDSYISGEAGRWRGNVADIGNLRRIDPLGPSAYWDTPTGESLPGCHRSRGAEINLPGQVAVNLACSGASTLTTWSGGRATPGIDDGVPDPATGEWAAGQLTLLGRLARRARVRLVVMSAGGNDMGFSAVVRACAADFLAPWPLARECATSPGVRGRLSDARLGVVGNRVRAAIIRVHATMVAAGYANGDWAMIVQDYPRPIALRNRYPETRRHRGYVGGCPFRDADVRWIDARLRVLGDRLRAAAAAAAATTGQPVRFLSLTDALAGRELCAPQAAQVDHLPAGRVPAGAERVSMIRAFSPFRAEESIHPNMLGQQALRACLLRAWNGGDARGGICSAPRDWADTDADGLPRVRFSP